MELSDLTLEDFMKIQNRFPELIVIAGKHFYNLTTILTMRNQVDFSVIYTENDFASFDVHRYICLRDAYEDYSNAYVVEI